MEINLDKSQFTLIAASGGYLKLKAKYLGELSRYAKVVMHVN